MDSDRSEAEATSSIWSPGDEVFADVGVDDDVFRKELGFFGSSNSSVSSLSCRKQALAAAAAAAAADVGNANKLRRRWVTGVDVPWSSFSVVVARRLSIPNQLRRRLVDCKVDPAATGGSPTLSAIMTDDSEPSSLAVWSQPCPEVAIVSLLATGSRHSSTAPVILSLFFTVIVVIVVVIAAAIAFLVVGI